jgi:putative ATP-dependent endonuclease of the OLD family
MRRVTIKNYRCLEDIEITFSDITTLIGANGAGKSSVLRALDWFFNGGKSSGFTEEDIRVGAEPRRIEVEVEFDDLTADDRAVLGEPAVLADVGRARAIIGRSWEWDRESYWAHGRGCPLFAEIRAAVSARDKNQLYKQFRAEHEDLELPAANSAAAVEQELQSWESAHPDQLRIERQPRPDLFSSSGEGQLRDVFDYVFVSADLRADEEARDVKSSIVGRILEHAIDRAGAESELIELIKPMADQYAAVGDRFFAKPLADLSERLTSAVREFTRGREISVKSALPEFRIPTVQFEVKVTDGLATTRVDQQGHGFRRALLISALRSLADSAPAADSRVMCLAIEEPELFQHPVQARAFATVLRGLAQDQSHDVQVAYATHSPFFLEAEGFAEVRRIARVPVPGTDASTVKVYSTSLQAVENRLAGTRQPAQVAKQLSGVFLKRLPEALFAGAVILVEGTTDQAILEGCALRGDALNVSGIVVVEVNGKDGIPLAHSILEELGVPCFVMFDGDGGVGGRTAAATRAEAEQSVGAANRRLLHYLGAAEQEHPATTVTDRWAVLQDTLEPVLNEWTAWIAKQRELIRDGRGLPGKDAATYRLAAIEADADPPALLGDIIARARALSPDG